MPEFQIPKRASLEDIKSILKGYYVEGAHNEPVRTSNVESTTQLGDKVGRQTPFLVEIGLLEKDGRKRSLTEVGAEIAEALMGGGEAMAKSELRDVLMEWEFTSKITGFVRMQGPVEEDQLNEYIKANAAADDDRGKETLLDLYLWTDILKKSGEGQYDVADAKQKTTDDEGDGESSEPDDESQQETHDPSPDQREESKHIGKLPSGGIAVDLQFTADDDPDDVLKVIVATRRGLTDSLDELVSEPDEDDVEQ